MQPKDTHGAAKSWVSPRVTRLVASEAELGIVEIGPDAERLS